MPDELLKNLSEDIHKLPWHEIITYYKTEKLIEKILLKAKILLFPRKQQIWMW